VIIEDGMTLNPEVCFELGLCKINQSVKILGHGDITKKINIEDIPTSGSAAEKIKAAGGTIV
jgi:large subunit ribosomal protein L15